MDHVPGILNYAAFAIRRVRGQFGLQLLPGRFIVTITEF
jgi:hypothetical protein